MAENTKIEWADHTFNPWEGCTKVGPGCDHCYAETRNNRFGGDNWGPGVPRRRTSAANWSKPLRWNREAAEAGVRYRVFCASLADWLDKEAPAAWLVDLLDLVRRTPDLNWLLLTKRIGNWRPRLELATFHLRHDISRNDRMQATLEWMQDWLDGEAPDNVWLGATIVNQEEADRDIPKLMATPAAVRFLSMEPLLGLVDLESAWFCESALGAECWGECKWCSSGRPPLHNCQRGLGSDSDRSGVDWVIVGGESGSGARPMQPDWARSLRDQCQVADVPFLFKQWGEWHPMGQLLADGYMNAMDKGQKPGHWDDATQSVRVGKGRAGRLLDGRTWDGFPEASP